jgi:subtilase family serine protease
MTWHLPVLLVLLTSTVAVVTAAASKDDNLVTIPVHSVVVLRTGRPGATALEAREWAAAAAAAQGVAVSQDTKLKLVVSLNSKDPKGLDRRARAVMDPTHSLYQQYLTPSQFGRAFGASTQAISSVRTYLTAQGLSVQLQPNRLTLEVSGTAAQVSKAFNTRLLQVQSQQLLDASSKATTTAAAVGTRTGKLLRAPSAHPKLPAHVAAHIAAVRGLDNLPVVSPSSTAAQKAAGTAGNRKPRSLLHQPGEPA